MTLGVFREKRDLVEAMEGLSHVLAWAHALPVMLAREDGDPEYETVVVLVNEWAVGGVLCKSAETFIPHRVWEVPPRENWFERGEVFREVVDFVWRDGCRVVVSPANRDRNVSRWLDNEWLRLDELGLDEGTEEA